MNSAWGEMQQGERFLHPRIVAIDVARGGALAGMALYHLSWDFAYFHLAPADLPTLPPMRLLSHSVAGTFLLLAGISQALAHQGGFRPRAFWRRLAILGGAAALVSVATSVFAPREAIYFGILHCIAVASLLGGALLSLPVWITFVLSALAFTAPLWVAGSIFDAPALFWLGLGATPSTLDWRPLLPWSGFVLLGLALARWLGPHLTASPFADWRPNAAAARGLAWAGRHSLAIYLIHQPILFALLFAATSATGYSAHEEAREFSRTCQRECVAGGGSPELCVAACECVVKGLQEAGIARVIAHGDFNDSEHKKFSQIVRGCYAGQRPNRL
jgi:uncharacterized membrane protein